MRGLLLLIILSGLLVSCKQVPPDVPVCQHLEQRKIFDADSVTLKVRPSPACMMEIAEPECGQCTYIRSGKQIYIGNKKENWFNGKSWDDLRYSAVIVPSEESFAPILTYMINSCKASECNKDITRFKVRFKK